METEEIQMHPQAKLIIDFLFANGYHKSKALWSVAFALKHPMTIGLSLQDAAEIIQCQRQAISKLQCLFKLEASWKRIDVPDKKKFYTI
jgi:hypothetical protein